MNSNRLSAPKVRNLVQANKPGLYGDGAGLWLQVSRFGSACWTFRYTRKGRTRDMGLGSLKQVSLKMARELAAEQRAHLLRGDDPIDLRRAKRDKARSDELSDILFKDAAKRFIDLYGPNWRNGKHRKQWTSTLEQYAYRSLGTRRAVGITGVDITDALAPIWQTKQETASRVKQRIDRVVQWVKDGMPLPQQGPSKRVRHHPALPFKALPDFMAELRERDGVSARALELTILTALRTSEVIGAKWDEIDFEAETWTVPAGRMKAHKQHTVPLSKRAVKVLKALPRIAGCAFVFPGAKGGHLSNMAMLELLQGMPGYETYTVHGFRSSFRDWSGDQTSYAREVIEHALAHRIQDKAEAAYRRGDALEKRRRLMDAWARYCESTPVEATVTSIRSA